MTRYVEKYAIALWKPDYEDLMDKHESFLNSADKCETVSTPDEDYIILYWNGLVIGSTEHFNFMLQIQRIRHSIVAITENGISTNKVVSDYRGCDEEFYEILGWKADICKWSDPDVILE